VDDWDQVMIVPEGGAETVPATLDSVAVPFLGRLLGW
jgi:hypothetical protein